MVESTLDQLGVQWVARYGTDWSMGWCPLHDDAGQSFTVHLVDGGWKCRAGCGSSGDLADLVEAVTGERADDVRLRLGRGAVNDPRVWERLVEPPKPRVVVTQQQVEERYPYQTGVVPRYLLRRGFTLETARRFGVGWDPGLRAVVVPVYMDGTLRGLVRRPIDWKQGDGTKYKNTQGLSDALLGLDLIPAGAEAVTVVEGPLDAMWLHQYGYPAVATLGSSISPVQADVLVRRFWRVVLAYDPDKAGLAGMRKARQLLARVQLRLLTLPPGRKDVQECTPDELAEAYGHLSIPGVQAAATVL